MNTYTKLKDGSWGLRVQGKATSGQSVTVTTKAGKEKTEIVKAVLWTGKDNRTGEEISLCSIKEKPRKYYPGQMCPCCGSEPLDSNLSCWECGFSGE